MSATGCQRGKLGKKESPSQESGEEEGRRRKKKEVRKSKKISFSGSFACPGLLFGIYSTFPCTSTSLPML